MHEGQAPDSILTRQPPVSSPDREPERQTTAIAADDRTPQGIQRHPYRVQSPFHGTGSR